MSLASLLAFSLIMFAGIVTPGPTVLLALNNAASFGIKRAIWGVLGAVVADVLLVSLVGLGLGVILAASEVIFVTVKWMGAAWLAYVGLRMILSSNCTENTKMQLQFAPTYRLVFMKSFLIAMSNPKYYIFMAALLPQFVIAEQPAFPQYASLGAIIVLIDITVMLSYAIIGIRAANVWKANGIKWMNRISGVFLLLLAGSIALYRKSME